MSDSIFLSKSVVLKSIGNAKRLEILTYLKTGEMSVGQLEGLVKLSQSALSQHLAVLRRADIVSTRRDAQTIYYSLNDQTVKKLLKVLDL